MATGLENLIIHKLAGQLEIDIFNLVNNFPKEELFRSVDQLKRSSSSVTNNIAESYFHRSIKDKIYVLSDIVKGEASETQSNLIMCLKKGFHSDQSIIERYTDLLKAISGYIRFLKKLTN